MLAKTSWKLFPGLLAFAFAAASQVSYEEIVNSLGTPRDWLTYSGAYNGWRYTGLREINAENVKRLTVKWVFQPPASLDEFEATPLVKDGIMYLPAQGNRVFALDARSGRSIWSYSRRLPSPIPACCGQVSRGLAALGNKVFLATMDASIVALDAKTGRVVWETKAADYKKAYTFTVAPLAVKDKILVGVSGGDYGIRGFIDAYSADSGKLAWRFYTVPASGEPGNETWSGDSWKRGGAPAWVTGSFDPELNLVYWGTGNPGPDHSVDVRKGSNLYSNSVVALDPDDGKLKWHFQFTPNDPHDYDSTQIPVLFNTEYEGRLRKLLAMANRNGFYYLLDRTDGKFLRAERIGRVTWAKSIGSDGRPIVSPGAIPTAEGVDVCPSLQGVTNWMSPSFSPVTNLFYVTIREECRRHFALPQKFEEGSSYWAGASTGIPGSPVWGALRAIDPLSGRQRWEFKYPHPGWVGVLSTASGLVFSGDGDGNFFAIHGRTGEVLWHILTGASIAASPMSFAINDRQHVAIASKNALFVFALPESTSSEGRR